jgi:hypothetical protein
VRTRRPSPERVLQYVREELIEGATVETVLAGRGRTHRESTLVRWRVWARLRAEGFSYKGIGTRFNMDHCTIVRAMRLFAAGREPYDYARRHKPPPPKPKIQIQKPGLVRFAGHDRSERFVKAKFIAAE